MHEQVCGVHILLDQGLVLLGVPSSDDKIVLACNEPNELFKPEHFSHDIPHLGLLELGHVTGGCSLCLFDCNVSCVLRLHFFLI